jgi:DNA-directed RNA polymerase subunit N (RpoN/RPB10)
MCVCGARVSAHWQSFCRRVNAGERRHAVLDALGVTRGCCRVALLGHEDLPGTNLPWATTVAATESSPSPGGSAATPR